MLHLAKSALDLHIAALGQARNLLKKWDRSSLEEGWRNQSFAESDCEISLTAGEVIVRWKMMEEGTYWAGDCQVHTSLLHSGGRGSSVLFEYKGLVSKSD